MDFAFFGLQITGPVLALGAITGLVYGILGVGLLSIAVAYLKVRGYAT